MLRAASPTLFTVVLLRNGWCRSASRGDGPVFPCCLAPAPAPDPARCLPAGGEGGAVTNEESV